MNNVLVIGGFTEGKRLLEPVAEEAVEQGFGRDAEVLTLREAVRMDDERLRKLMAARNVITHSAGLFAVPDARKIAADSELPEDVIVIAGPEPRPISALAAAANSKTLDHVFGATTHPRSAHLRVVASNTAELVAHPFANRALVPDISRLSTLDRLDTEQVTANGRIGSFVMSDDAFYADAHWSDRAVVQNLGRGGYVMAELPGDHDELLIDPANVLRGVRQAFEARENR